MVKPSDVFTNANGQTVAMDSNGSWKVYDPDTGAWGRYAIGPTVPLPGPAPAGIPPAPAAAPAAAVPPPVTPPAQPAAAPAAPVARPAGSTRRAWIWGHKWNIGIGIVAGVLTIIFASIGIKNSLFPPSPATEVISMQKQLDASQEAAKAATKERDDAMAAAAKAKQDSDAAIAAAEQKVKEALAAAEAAKANPPAPAPTPAAVQPPPAPPAAVAPPPAPVVAAVAPKPQDPRCKLEGTVYAPSVKHCVPI